MPQIKTHYDNLQVKETASDEVIRGAYRYLSQKWHPDRNTNNREESERILKIINRAYATLSDPARRKEHDEWIARQRESDQEASQAPPPPHQSTHQPANRDRAKPSFGLIRPWVRFWARVLDTCLFAAVFGGVVGGLIGGAIGFIYPAAFLGENPLLESNEIYYQLFQHIIWLGLSLAWVFGESVFLSTIGTTPGKWLLRIRIEHRAGKPSFKSAFNRSLKVWSRGMAAGLPIATIVANLIAYYKLTNNGETTWDRDAGFTISHQPIGGFRVTAAIVLIIATLLPIWGV